MANINAPRGLTPCGDILRVRRYYKSAAVALGVGDPVIRSADSADPQGYQSVTRHTADAAVTGVVVGVEPDPNRTTKHYLASGDTGYLLVSDSPNQEYYVQDNGGATGIVITNLGQHVDTVTALDCDTKTGRSKVTLDTETLATGNTWLLCRKSDRPNNAVGAYCEWVVRPNLTTEANASATNLTET